MKTIICLQLCKRNSVQGPFVSITLYHRSLVGSYVCIIGMTRLVSLVDKFIIWYSTSVVIPFKQLATIIVIITPEFVPQPHYWKTAIMTWLWIWLQSTSFTCPMCEAPHRLQLKLHLSLFSSNDPAPCTILWRLFHTRQCLDITLSVCSTGAMVNEMVSCNCLMFFASNKADTLGLFDSIHPDLYILICDSTHTQVYVFAYIHPEVCVFAYIHPEVCVFAYIHPQLCVFAYTHP